MAEFVITPENIYACETTASILATGLGTSSDIWALYVDGIQVGSVGAENNSTVSGSASFATPGTHTAAVYQVSLTCCPPPYEPILVAGPEEFEVLPARVLLATAGVYTNESYEDLKTKFKRAAEKGDVFTVIAADGKELLFSPFGALFIREPGC